MKKTILLTGATGYLGSYLAKMLLDFSPPPENDHYFLIALCLNNSEKFKYCDNKNVKVYYLSQTSIKEIFDENKIDIVIHTAVVYGRCDEQTCDMIKANVEFPLKVLSEAINHNTSVFINTDTILTKNVSPYALTKYQFCEWLSMYCDKIKCVDIKLDHFYGPNDKTIKFIAWLVEQFKNNVKEINLTEGSQTRDFIFIDDVVDAYRCVLENIDKLSSGILNIFELGTNKKTSIRYLVNKLKELTGADSILKFGALPYRKNEVLDYNINTTALRLLGWEPKVFLENGLKRVLMEEQRIDK